MEKPRASEKPKLLTGDFVLLFAMALCLYIGMDILPVVVPLFVMENLGGTAAVTGLLSTVYTLSACLMRPVGSVLTGRFRRRTMMIVGCAVFGLAAAFCGVVPALAALFLGRILQGVGYSLASTANNTASTDIIPPSRLAEGIGYFGMSQSVAGAIGPALASAAVVLVGNRNSFYLVALCGLAGILLAAFVRYEHRDRTNTAAPSEEREHSSAVERTAIPAALMEFGSLFCLVTVMCFATPYLKVDRGFGAWVPGAFFAVSAVVIVVLRLLLSRFLGRHSHLTFLLPGYVLAILMCVLLPVLESPMALVCSGVLYGAAHGLIWMAMGYEAVRRAPQSQKGAANATFYLAFDAAIGIGSGVWGFVIDGVGYANTYHIVIACLVVLIVLACIFFRKKQ